MLLHILMPIIVIIFSYSMLLTSVALQLPDQQLQIAEDIFLLEPMIQPMMKRHNRRGSLASALFQRLGAVPDADATMTVRDAMFLRKRGLPLVFPLPRQGALVRNRPVRNWLHFGR